VTRGARDRVSHGGWQCSRLTFPSRRRNFNRPLEVIEPARQLPQRAIAPSPHAFDDLRSATLRRSIANARRRQQCVDGTTV
jgi:hypothetical protein